MHSKDGPARFSDRFGMVCLGAAVVLSAVPPMMHIHWGRLGFLLAGVALLLALIARWPYGERLRAIWRAHRLLVVSLSCLVVGRLLSVISAEAVEDALLQGVRIATLAVFFAAVYFECQRNPGMRAVLAWGAALLIALHGVLFISAWCFGELFRLVFEAGTHQYLGGLPRFRGIVGGPFACGAMMLACAGLVRALPDRRFAAPLMGVALFLCAASLSFATMALPVMLLWLVVRQRSWRIAGYAVLAVVAISILYAKPVALRCGGNSLPLFEPHENYHLDELGPRYAPQTTLTISRCQIDVIPSGYVVLAGASLRCFRDNWLIGVGGRNHPYSCPATAMTALGQWTTGRIAHNEYTGLLAEYGLLGLAGTLFFVWVVWWRYRKHSLDNWTRGIVGAYLLAGFAGEIWFQFPFVALIASHVGNPGSGGGNSERSQSAYRGIK